MLFYLEDMPFAKSFFTGTNQGRQRSMMAILVFSNHCKWPHENAFFFSKKDTKPQCILVKCHSL